MNGTGNPEREGRRSGGVRAAGSAGSAAATGARTGLTQALAAVMTPTAPSDSQATNISRVIAVGAVERSAARESGAAAKRDTSLSGARPASARAPQGGVTEEDEVTTVDAACGPLSPAERSELEQRIRVALDQTVPLGTPSPIAPPVQFGGAATPRRSHPLGRTLLLGAPLQESPSRGLPLEAPSASTRGEPAALAAAPAAAAVRASPVRAIGLPTAPPPRRSRRAPGASAVPPPAKRVELEHDAFALERRASTAHPESAAAIRGVVPSLGASARGILPPLADRTSPAPAFDETRKLALGHESARGDRQLAGLPRAASSFPELSSDDVWASFAAPATPLWRRVAFVMIATLAVVGGLALAALVVDFLGGSAR